MAQKEIEITIKEDGTVDLDQFGWEGKSCDGAIEDLIKVLGKVKKTNKKPEYNRNVKIYQQQKGA